MCVQKPKEHCRRSRYPELSFKTFIPTQNLQYLLPFLHLTVSAWLGKAVHAWQKMYSYWAQSCLLIFPTLWSCCRFWEINKACGNLVFRSLDAYLSIQFVLCFPIHVSYPPPSPILLITDSLNSVDIAPPLCFLHWINYCTCIEPKKNYDGIDPFRTMHSCLCSPRSRLHVLAAALSFEWLISAQTIC